MRYPARDVVLAVQNRRASSLKEGSSSFERSTACRNGGTVSVIGVYSGFIDKFPMGAVMNRSLTIRAGQAHVQHYIRKLFEKIQEGEIDPTFLITHRMRLEDAPAAYDIFDHKQDECVKVVLHP